MLGPSCSRRYYLLAVVEHYAIDAYGVQNYARTDMLIPAPGRPSMHKVAAASLKECAMILLTVTETLGHLGVVH